MSGKVYQYIIRMRDEATSKLQMLARAAGLADTGLSRAARTAQQAAGGFSDLGGKLRGAAAAFGLFLSVQAGIGAVQDVARIQSLNNSIVFASGSAQEGAKSLRFLSEESNRLGLDQLAATEGFKTFSGSMMGQGVEMDKIRQMYSQVATGATAMGLSGEDAKGVFLALGQIMSKGKVQAEELRGQIGERVPGAFQIAARAMNMTTAQLDKFMSDGKLTSDVFLPRFAAEMQKTFAGALPVAMQSLQANINRLSNGFLELKTSAVQQFMPEIMSLVAFLKNNAVPTLGAMFKWLGENKTMLTQVAIAGAVLATAYYALTGAQALAVWWAGASTAAFYAQYIATYGLSGAFTVLNAIMRANPIGFIITLLAALAAGIIWAWNNVDWFRNGLTGLWEVAKYVFFGIGEWITTSLVPSLKGIWTALDTLVLPSLRNFWDVTKEIFRWVYDNRHLLLAPFMPLVYVLDKIGAFKGVKAAFDKGYNAGGVQSVTNTDALGKYYADKEGDGVLDRAAGGKPPGGPADPKADKTLSDISNGGTRTSNITLNISNKFDIRAGSAAEAARSTARTFAEELFRELNGAVLSVNQ